MSGFGIRKSLLIEKVPTGEMGDLVVLHAHLAHWTRLRVFKGLREHIFGSAGGASFIWRMLELGHLWFKLVVPEKQNQYLLKQDRAILRWFCSYNLAVYTKDLYF